MTTNIDRAAEVLYNEGVGSGETRYYLAHRLADAGLLAPDLPEPTSSGWVVNTKLVREVTLGVGAKVALLPHGIEFQETHITPTEARELALALLAAANHAEKDMAE